MYEGIFENFQEMHGWVEVGVFLLGFLVLRRVDGCIFYEKVLI